MLPHPNYDFSVCGGDGTKFDIAFLFDDSGSITNANFDHQKNFFKCLAEAFYVGTNFVNIASLAINDVADEHFGLTQHLTTTDVSTALDSVPDRGGASGFPTGLGKLSL